MKDREHNGQKFEDTKAVIRRHKSMKDRRTDNTMAKRQKNRQHNGQKTEEQTTQWPKDRRTDNTMAKRKKNRQHNGQKNKYKRANNDSQNIHIKLKIE